MQSIVNVPLDALESCKENPKMQSTRMYVLHV
jgi:hypothetical protein